MAEIVVDYSGDNAVLTCNGCRAHVEVPLLMSAADIVTATNFQEAHTRCEDPHGARRG